MNSPQYSPCIWSKYPIYTKIIIFPGSRTRHNMLLSSIRKKKTTKKPTTIFNAVAVQLNFPTKLNQQKMFRWEMMSYLEKIFLYSQLRVSLEMWNEWNDSSYPDFILVDTHTYPDQTHQKKNCILLWFLTFSDQNGIVCYQQ